MKTISHVGRMAAIGAVLVGQGVFGAGDVDPAKWAQLKQGMTESEVISILGEPLRREKPAANFSTLIYDEIVPKGRLFPDGLACVVWLDDQNTFASLETPFDGALPRNGLPGQPAIFLPQTGNTFHHYPRILDVRWHAVVGTYPMEYEAEQDTGYEADGKLTWHTSKTYRTKLPHLSILHVGAQPGRIRVRALNADGTGEWSEYVVFEFDR